MEKKKKTGVEVKKENVKKKNESKIVFSSNVKKYTKIVSLILAFFATAAIIFTFVFGLIVSLKVADYSREELLHDNFSVTFISNMHGTSIHETEETIANFGNHALFIIFQVVVPVLIFITAMVLLIILLKTILNFVNRIDTEKELFCEENIPEVDTIACYIMTILTITIITFNRTSPIIYGLVCLLIFIVLKLFRKCVEDRK